jgi:cobalt-zinc-cadmium efflux system membrane fusion protein
VVHGSGIVPSSPGHGKAPLSRQVVISVIIVAGLAITGFTLSRAGKTEPDAAPPAGNPNQIAVSEAGKSLAGIATGPVVEESVQSDLKTSGVLSYPADQTVNLSPRLQGRITQLFVHVGDRVVAGQTVAQLVSADGATAETTALQNGNKLRQASLDLQRQERLFRLGTPDVTAAQAAFDQAVVAAEAAKDVLNTTTSQSKIGGFTEKPLEDASNGLIAANASLDQARSDLRLAEKDYLRKQKLVQIGVAAQADLEVSQDTYEKAKTAVAADDDAAKLAQQAVDRERKAFGSNLYSKQQVEAAQNAYRQALVQKSAAATALQLAKTQIQRDREQARSDYQSAVFDDQNSQKTLAILGHPNADGTLNVTSPISGTVTALSISPGQTVDQSQMTPWQIMTISNTATLWVEADVYEKDIAAIDVGSKVKVRVSALQGREFEGTVLRISPVVDKTSRTVKVRAIIPNSNGLLKDGEYADVTIAAGHPHHAMLAPLTAVEHEGDTDYVFIKDGAKFDKQKVELGAPFGDKVEIKSGLKSGDVVVTKGAIYLGDQESDD